MKIKHICVECGKIEWRKATIIQGNEMHNNVEMICDNCFKKRLRK